MRIGVDIRTLLDQPLTGVGEYTTQLLGELLSFKTEDRYVLFSNSFRRQAALPETWPTGQWELKTRSLPNKIFNLSLRAFGRPGIEELLGPLDCFFAPNINVLALPPALPFILTVHDLSFLHFHDALSLRRRLWHRFVQPERLIARADGIIAVSQATAEDLHMTLGVPVEKIFMVHSGVKPVVVTQEECAQVRSRYRLPEEFLLTLSTIEPRKNLLTLLDAYAVLCRDFGHHLPLVIAGAPGWSTASFTRAVAEHPFRRSIHLLPYVEEGEKHCLYAMAKLFLLLSVYEGFGFPPLEAAFQGTPVIVGHHSSLSEIMGDAAMLVDVHNARDVAAAAHALLGDQSLRTSLAASAVKLQERYTWSRTAAATREVFHTVTKRHADRA